MGDGGEEMARGAAGERPDALVLLAGSAAVVLIAGALGTSGPVRLVTADRSADVALLVGPTALAIAALLQVALTTIGPAGAGGRRPPPLLFLGLAGFAAVVGFERAIFDFSAAPGTTLVLVTMITAMLGAMLSVRALRAADILVWTLGATVMVFAATTLTLATDSARVRLLCMGAEIGVSLAVGVISILEARRLLANQAMEALEAREARDALRLSHEMLRCRVEADNERWHAVRSTLLVLDRVAETTTSEAVAAALYSEIDRLRRMLDDDHPDVETLYRLDDVLRRVVLAYPTMAIHLDADPTWVIGRSGHVEEIVRLLLDNVSRHAAATRTIVSVSVDEGTATVRIADNGVGISDEIAARIFDRGLTTDPSGTGLGLALARQMAHRESGELVLENTHRGCAFEVRIPSMLDGGSLDRVDPLPEKVS